MGFDQRFDLKFRGITGRYAGLALQASQAANRAVVDAANEARDVAQKNTPRSAEGADHIADHWKVEVEAEGAGVTARVVNDSERGNAEIRLKSGRKTTLLAILEYGSRAHVIKPKTKGRFLVFFWGLVGRTVYARAVNHPGTRPYSMMRLARLAALLRLKKRADAISVVVRLAALGQTARLLRASPFRGDP
jgi:hypothetical protein